jgi:hypothetical protein
MSTPRRPCPPAPGPLEDYCVAFDSLFVSYAQRNSFRRYLEGLLLPRDRNKTLTALAGAEPILGAQEAAVQRLQFFLCESPWDAEVINQQRLNLLLSDPATKPHAQGVLVVDETGDRKWGMKTAFQGRQYLGSRGKVESGIVCVSSVWADERLYYPLHVEPYIPASRLPDGKADPAFRTKPQLAAELIRRAQVLGVPFRAVVADCLYGENNALLDELIRSQTPFVLGLRARGGRWAPAQALHTAEEAAQSLGWKSEKRPGKWRRLVRHFREGREETWWIGELCFAGFSPEHGLRAIVATTDPKRLPDLSTWYVTTNLPLLGTPGSEQSPFEPADLEEVVRLYGLKAWVEQSYKQVKHELGWADFAVRSDAAIRRHWNLVFCAFSFCWRAYLPALEREPTGAAEPEGPREEISSGRKKNRDPSLGTSELAMRSAPGTQLARALVGAPALVESVVTRAPTEAATPTAGVGR